MRKAKPVKRNAPVKPGVYARTNWFKVHVRGTTLPKRFTTLVAAVKARDRFLSKLPKQAVAC